jgi:hypothetical protein
VSSRGGRKAVRTSLDVLLAKNAIHEQMCNYCRAADRSMDVHLFRSVWHGDGTMDYEGTTMCGLAADLAQTFIDSHLVLERHVHHQPLDPCGR